MLHVNRAKILNCPVWTNNKLKYCPRVVFKKWGAGDFPHYYECGPCLLSKENRRKREPEKTPSCLISHLLVVFTRQLEILVTTLLSSQLTIRLVPCECSVSFSSKINTRQIGKRTKSLVEVNQKLTPLKLFSCILSFMPFIKGGKNSKRNCDDITRERFVYFHWVMRKKSWVKC